MSVTDEQIYQAEELIEGFDQYIRIEPRDAVRMRRTLSEFAAKAEAAGFRRGIEAAADAVDFDPELRDRIRALLRADKETTDAA